MGDESAAIVEILPSVGGYDFVMDRVKDQAKAVEMSKTDFNTLMQVCAEGA